MAMVVMEFIDEGNDPRAVEPLLLDWLRGCLGIR